jgi:hypothetical protein
MRNETKLIRYKQQRTLRSQKKREKRIEPDTNELAAVVTCIKLPYWIICCKYY